MTKIIMIFFMTSHRRHNGQLPHCSFRNPAPCLYFTR